MMRDLVEFEIGDYVTFNAYGYPLLARVKSVDVDCNFSKDNRIFYKLLGEYVNTVTTGLCIEESIYFEEYKDHKILGEIK